MSEPDQPPTPDRLCDLLEDGKAEQAVTCLNRLGSAAPDARKRSLRAVRDIAEERPTAFEGVAAPLSGFLVDEVRAVRLTTAKLFVTLARADPAVVLPAVDTLAGRLGDDDEFYYVRARCAEALGYVAVEAPEAVIDPETLADLRLGLEFDEPEVKEKLAKALAHVALGDASRLRHRVSSLAEHLDDENELVRYHLCTALVVVGCERAETLTDAANALRERLADENPYVQGRAAEALGLLAGAEVESGPDPAELDIKEDSPSFLSKRVRFCRRRLAGEESGASPDGVATTESVRDGTDDVVEEMKAPDGSECAACGAALPADGPPVCPRCGAPR